MAVLTAEAPALPVALDEVKAFLRVEGSAQDAEIAGFVRSAEAACEAFTGAALIAREAAQTLPAATQWQRLGMSPVRSIAAVAALAQDGAETALPPDAYAIDVDASGDGWVRAIRSPEPRVIVRFTAGMAANWNGVPEPLRHGIVRLAAHLYAVRGSEAAAPPALVAALWRPFRRVRMG